MAKDYGITSIELKMDRQTCKPSKGKICKDLINIFQQFALKIISIANPLYAEIMQKELKQ